MIHVLTSLDKMIENKEFSKNNVFFISVEREFSFVDFKMLDNTHQVTQFGINGNDYLFKTRKIFEELQPDDDLVNSSFTSFSEKKYFHFSLDKKGLNELKNLLLSDKLKTSLNYALIDAQLSAKHIDTKKPKI